MMTLIPMMKIIMSMTIILKMGSPVLDYQHQVEALTDAGFALWDVVIVAINISLSLSL